MIQIQPITIGLPAQEATQITIRPVIQSTRSTNCYCYYQVFTENNVVLATGEHILTEEEYVGWGVDNIYVEDIVLTYLGLVRVI